MSDLNDDDLRRFIDAFRRIEDKARRLPYLPDETYADLTQAVDKHLGVASSGLVVLEEDVPRHRFVDWDIALEEMASRDPEAQLVGMGGGASRYNTSLSEITGREWDSYPLGQVEYVNVPSGPGQTRQTVSLGLRMFTYQDQPVVVKQTRPRYTHDACELEAVSPDPQLTAAFLDEARALADNLSILRGKVVSIDEDEDSDLAYNFLAREEVSAEDVVLPDGALERLHAHTVGVAANADKLRSLGQHLKRGVLLYGPPGSGKTHTVRHLLGLLPEHTVLVLRGKSLNHIATASRAARMLQPSVVVLEDVDLVAEERSFGGDADNPVLFDVLDSVDGLDADVDVTFLFTTNRIDVLEAALAQRPGRVDLAVEVPLPDEASRLRLLRVYGRELSLSDEALEEAARRSDGVTGSFAKELMRRTVLRAVARGEEPQDHHLLEALTEQLADAERLNEARQAAGLESFAAFAAFDEGDNEADQVDGGF